MKSRIGRRLGTLVLALAAMTAGLVATPSVANAANTSICHDGSYGGDWFCAY